MDDIMPPQELVLYVLSRHKVLISNIDDKIMCSASEKKESESESHITVTGDAEQYVLLHFSLPVFSS
jgi:hypothetical protein